MLAADPQERTSDQPMSSPFHQIYVTHCLYDEGVQRQAGFAVRAASTRDPLLLRFAQEYPPYELPAGLQGTDEDFSGVQPRLALVRVPGASKALIHSVPVPVERHGRANNFFSHVLISPTLTACDALRLWGSPDWTTECWPTTGKELDQMTAIEPGPLNDQAVTAFLQPDPGQASPFCPERLGTDGRHRREMLSLTLRGCLLALQAPPGSPRSRFFLVAEPELAVLLLYGAVRLLPPQLAAQVTFSTYESMRPSLRTYRHAQLVGTWAGQPDQTLDEEFFTTRSYAFDTLRHTASGELYEQGPSVIEEWLDLASQGDWKLLDTVYQLLGNTGDSLVSFHQGFQAAKLTQRLTKGKAEAADLIALKRTPWGSTLLEQHGEKVWPLVRDASLRDSAIREEFADVLSAHVSELEQKVTEALRIDPPGEWQTSWRLLKSVLLDDPGQMRDTLQRIVPPPPYSPVMRFSLLAEFQDLHFFPLQQQLPLHPLLRQCSAEELERFARSGLPREWYVWALYYALLKKESQAEATRHLHGGDDPLLALFWEQFKLVKEENQRRAILAPLLASRDGKAVLFFSRSLKMLLSLRIETFQWILEQLDALSREWIEFWCAEDHLARLLDILRGLGEEGEPIWHRFLAYLDGDLPILRDPLQRTILLQLAGAIDRPGPALPEKVTQFVADHVLLREHFEKASAVPPADRPAIIAACQRLNLDAVSVLKRYFERFVLPQEMNPTLTNDFAGFFHSFYLDGSDYQSHASRLIGWREVVAVCPESSRRGAYQSYYLEQVVPVAFRDRLREEVLQEPREVLGPVNPAPIVELPKTEAAVPLPAVGNSGLFQLTGMQLGAGAVCMRNAIVKGSPWLLVSFASGLLALVFFDSIKVPPRQQLLLCSFIPLILAVTESMTLQSLALSIGAFGGRPSSRQEMLHGLGTGGFLGMAIAIVGGSLAGGAAFGWGIPIGNALCVGIAVASGMLSASVLGLTLPVLLARWSNRLPIGPIVRALAGAAALGLYIYASRWLLR